MATKDEKERLAILETRMTSIENKVDCNHQENKEDHKEIKELIEKFVDAADNKYAGKEEVKTIKFGLKVMWLLVVSVLGTVVGVLIYYMQAFTNHINR